MTAIIIKHHPKMLQRWASNAVLWYKMGGKKLLKDRTAFLTSEDVVAVNPIIKEEFTKQGFNV